MIRRVPIRVKLMITLLVMVTTVVGLITFSTASSFQNDKQAYVNDLTSMVALGMAEETRAALVGYRERLGLYARLIVDDARVGADREALTRRLFSEFTELLGVVVEPDDMAPSSAYSVSALESVGLSREQLEAFQQAHPIPWTAIGAGKAHVVNSTLSDELPSFTLAFHLEADQDGAPGARVVAVLRSERLIQLVSRFSAYDQVLVGSDGKVLAHAARAELKKLPAFEAPFQLDLDGGLNASMGLEYSLNGVEMLGGFAGVDFGEVIALAQIPRSAAHLASRQVMQRLVFVAVGLLLVAIVVGFLFAHRLTRPIERLSNATRTIAGGSFDVQVDVESKDEMGELAESFNHMTTELRLRESKLKEAHVQLVHSEKMAAFGQLGAGIAHEVKNPLTGILACAQLAVDDVEPGSRLHEDLALIEKETRRCKSIIDNLLKFARQEKAEMHSVDVIEVLESSVAIVNHQLQINQVRVETELPPDLPRIHGNANQLQQVFVNLMINAQQAMDGEPGSLRISSVSDADGSLVLRFEDTGPGIPEAIRDKLFEPFFTTKEAGKGTGLGLSVSFGIIRDHDGQIVVESEIGQGTTFVITLPVEATDAAADPAVIADLESLAAAAPNDELQV